MKLGRYVLLSLTLSLNSCSLIHFLSMKDRVPECSSEYNKFLLKNDVDTNYSYQIALNYRDSISYEKYAINQYKLKSNAKASPIQIRFYSRDGELLNGYEQCFGDINEFELLDSLPMKSVSWLPINYKLSLKNDLNLINLSMEERNNILFQKDKYNYVIIVMYSVWSNWYSKHTLRAINSYIKKYGEANFLFIKVNTSP
jgi:hypothetical protein